MSDFRKQLDQAKADYQSARFPGDLASLVIAPPTRNRTYWRLGIALAAASVALAVGLFWPAKSKTSNTPIARVDVPDFVTPAIPSAAVEPTHATDDTVAVVTSDSSQTPAVVAMPDSQSLPTLPTFPTEAPTMPASPGDSYSSFPTTPTLPGFNSTTDTITTSSEKDPT